MSLKKILTILLSFSVIGLYAQVQISESNSSRYSFFWNLEQYRVDTVKSDQQYSQIFFDAENTVLGENGEAALPGYSILLGIPPQGEVRIGLNPEAVKTITLPVSLLKHKDLVSKRQPDVVFKNPWISEPVYGTLQGMRTVRFIIRPFIHDEKTNTVKVLQRGFCSIEFPTYPLRVLSSSEQSKRSPMLGSMVINYQVANGWYDNRRLAKVAVPSFPANLGQAFRFRIGDGNISDNNEDDYNEMTTKENGILKIPGDSIIKHFGRKNINEVKLYASFKGELPIELLDTSVAIPTGLSEVPLLRIDRNKNTIVDSDDYFLAFVTGASDWFFNNDREYSYKLDRYDDYRNYWLTFSAGAGMSVNSYHVSGIPGDTISSVQNRILHGVNLSQISGSEGGLEWIWFRLSNGRSNEFSLPLPGLDTSWGGSITIKSPFGDYMSTDVFVSDRPIISENGVYTVNRWGNRILKLVAKTDGVEIQYVDASYKRKLIIGNAEKLEFFSPVDTMLYTYKVKVSTNDLLYLFRISNDEKNVSLIDTIRNAADSFISWSDTGGKGIRYMICSEKALTLLPQRNTTTDKVKADFLIDNPRVTSDSTDYLIISAPEFLDAALKLAAHKKKIGFNAPRVVNVKDVYDAFSGGDMDPTAIKNFITYVQTYWKGSQYLSYVLLFGNGHYDYKGVIKPRKPIYIPVYYGGRTALEDYFTLRYGNVQAALGRISCDSVTKAYDVVDKIITMEDPQRADYSDWRNRVLLVADDDRQGTTPDGINHHKSSDITADVIESKIPSVNIRKVYLFDYKWNSASQKPEASKAIFNEIDNGVGYVNYFGHGEKEQWAQEKVLLPENVKNLSNTNRYPLISSFSCSVGKFDVPNYECLSSVLLTTGKRGAIVSLSSTRTAYASSNEYLAIEFYSTLFNPDTLHSIGMAFCKAKGNSFSSFSRSYAILGDPSIIIVNPTNSIKMSVHNKTGETKDTLMALQQVTVSGSVVDRNGNTVSSYGANEPAYIQLGLFNPAEETGRKDGGEDVSIRYYMPGTAVFMGKTQVKSGNFQQIIQLPGNLAFNKSGVKLTAYAWREGKTEAATGFKGDLIFSGTDPSVAANDSAGPQITIRPVHDYPEMTTEKMSFSGHVIEMDSLKCEVDVFDPSGIDVIGTGPDEGITFEIEGVSRQLNINHKFRFAEGDFRKGSVMLRENALKPGNYTLNITARDLQGNLSKSSFQIKITQPQEFKLDQVFNSPNPFKMGRGTRFYFFPTNTSYQTFAAIKIYTLSGKPVCVIKNAVNGQFWDGRDQTGTLLSPDIYLYQIVASAQKEKGTERRNMKSKIMKLVINP